MPNYQNRSRTDDSFAREQKLKRHTKKKVQHNTPQSEPLPYSETLLVTSDLDDALDEITSHWSA